MIERIINDVSCFAARFVRLPEVYQARVLAKTVIVAAAAFLATGLLFGGLAGSIAFSGAVIYVSTSVAGRTVRGENVGKAFNKDIKDLRKSVTTNIKDLTAASKAEKEAREVKNFLTSCWNELKFTMSL